MARRVPFPLPLLLALACGSACAADDDLTVYRCTDARGKLTLQDKPCAQGQTQQTRQMLRLSAPPPKPLPPPAALTAAPAAPPPVVVVRTPQPLYECIRDDGERYTSDDGQGDPRWVPAWIGDGGYYGSFGGQVRVASGSGRGGGSRSDSGSTYTDRPGGGPQVRLITEAPRPPPPPPRPPRGGGVYYAGYGYGAAGVWVRDPCHALPQSEVCARIGDRRDEIRRRFFNAQPTERAELSREERGINARLAADCGAG